MLSYYCVYYYLLLHSVCTVTSVYSYMRYGTLKATLQASSVWPQCKALPVGYSPKGATIGYGVKEVQGKSIYLLDFFCTRGRRVKNIQWGWKPMKLFPVPVFSVKTGLFYLSWVLECIRLKADGKWSYSNYASNRTVIFCFY